MIPIYRAKKIDSDEYIIGFYSSAYDIHHYIITHLGVDTKVNVVYQMSTDIHKIDPTTLAIHLPDMLDSQENKIFASLSEDGKGGDICEFKDWDSAYEDEFLNKGTCLYENLKIVFTNRYEVMMEDLNFKYDVKVIGIQE